MPILHAGLETDLRLAVALEQALLVTLTDMASLRNIAGLVDFHGSVNGSGSDTSRLRFVSLGGADHFSATAAEDTDVAETALADTSVDIAVARAALVRNVGDLAVATGFGDDIDPARLAADMIASYEGYFNGLLAAAGATATTNVGTSGVDMSVDDFHDAIYTLEIADVPTPYYAVLAPRQFADFQESLRGEGGSAAFNPATADMLRAAGQGLAGEYLGVTLIKSSDVTTAGGNREGWLHGAGAFGYKIAIIDDRSMLGAGAATVVRADEIVVEVTRDSSRSLTEIVGNAYVGLSVKEQARLVGIVTDA